MNHNSIEEIPIELLLDHPENSNHMNSATAQKLRRHIEQTGRYEPLTVRPHPCEKGKFQVINGHNRLRVLRSLNYSKVYCAVWDINDDRTRLYLATLNRLSGVDIPERRATLLENLFGTYDANELSLLLPDNAEQIETLRKLSKIDPDEFSKQDIAAEKLQIPVIMTFMVEESVAKEVYLALDLLIQKDKELSRSQALLQLARFYLSKIC
jgi:hypothetical protein